MGCKWRKKACSSGSSGAPTESRSTTQKESRSETNGAKTTCEKQASEAVGGARLVKKIIASYLSKGFKVVKFDNHKFLFKVTELCELLTKVEVVCVNDGYHSLTTCKPENAETCIEKLARNLAHLPLISED